MAQTQGAPVDRTALAKQLWVEAQVNKGMVTIIDPADIDDGALTKAKNCRIRYDKTSRRPGLTPLLPADSDTSQVLGLAAFKKNSGLQYLVKLLRSGPRYTDFSTWFGPTGAGLTGAAKQRFSHCVTQDQFIFANGKDQIQYLTIGAPGTFQPLGNAPKAKFVTGFYNRVVAANYVDPVSGTPVTLGWSGDLNPTEWDPLVDISAGSNPLVDSPSDTADFLSGVFGFSNVLVILRERSIWMATKQPIGSNPFFFSAAVVGIGCNCPYSVAVIPNGLIWVDAITGSVWEYTLGSEPERIGLSIENNLVEGLDDPNQLVGSYSAVNHEYSVHIDQAGSTIRRIWTYNLRTKAWIYDELDNSYSISDIIGLTLPLTIDALTGSVDGLLPIIDGLVAAAPKSTSRLVGMFDGSILREEPSIDNDGPRFSTIDNLAGLIDNLAGTIDNLSTLTTEPYETVLASKDFMLPQIDKYIAEVRVEFIANIGGTLILEYSKDGGNTWRTVKTLNVTTLKIPQILRFVGQYKAKRFRWQVRAVTGNFDVINYEVHVFAGAESKQGQL